MSPPTRIKQEPSAQVPMVLGVVGHVDLSDPDGKAAYAVAWILLRVLSRYPHTPIDVLSNLADGAGQLVVKVVQDLIKDNPKLQGRLRIRAALPFPPKVYADCKDAFLTDSARNNLLEWAHPDTGPIPYCVVPLPDGPDPDSLEPAVLADWDKLRDNRDDRYRCYANVGGYIVRHSLALIALWDGVENLDLLDCPAHLFQDIDMTAGMVRFMYGGRLPRHHPPLDPLLAGGDIGPVIDVRTSRSQDDGRATTGANQVPAPAGGVSRPTGPKAPAPDNIRILVPPEGGEVPRKLWENPPGPWRMFARRAFGFFVMLWLGFQAWFNRTFGWRVFGRFRIHFAGPARIEFWKYLETARNIEEYNRDLAGLGQELTGRIEKATARILERNRRKATERMARRHRRKPPKPGWKEGWLPRAWKERFLPAADLPDRDRPALERLARTRMGASEIAKSLDTWLKRSNRLLFAVIFLALVCFHLYAHLFRVVEKEPEHDLAWLWLFLLLLDFAVVIVGVVWYLRIDSRRLDYRVLAEALRVRYYWAIAGVDRSVAETYLGHLRGEMAWARRALHAISPPPQQWKWRFEKLSDAQKELAITCVYDRWAKDQLRYFRVTQRREHWRGIILRISGVLLAACGWGLSAWLLWAWVAENPGGPRLILSSLLVIAGGLLIAYCERRAHEAMSRQYENMHAVFRRGVRELRRCIKKKNWEEAKRVIEALGREAIIEHVHWLVLHRAHPFELVIGG